MNSLLRAEPALDIFEAAALGRAERVGELLRANPGAATAFAPDGFTALHLAAYFGHVDVVRLLIEQGAAVNAVARNPMQVMPLHSAVSSGRLDVCELLLARGAEVNARQHGGWTPLHGAAQNGGEALVTLLLARGARPDLCMDDGQDPAETATAAGHDELARRLSTPDRFPSARTGEQA